MESQIYHIDFIDGIRSLEIVNFLWQYFNYSMKVKVKNELFLCVCVCVGGGGVGGGESKMREIVQVCKCIPVHSAKIHFDDSSDWLKKVVVCEARKNSGCIIMSSDQCGGFSCSDAFCEGTKTKKPGLTSPRHELTMTSRTFYYRLANETQANPQVLISDHRAFRDTPAEFGRSCQMNWLKRNERSGILWSQEKEQAHPPYLHMVDNKSRGRVGRYLPTYETRKPN